MNIEPKLYQDLDPELRWILSQLCFECIHTARALRKMGHVIPNKAEDEQAAALNWMLGMYAKHGAGWRTIAVTALNEAAGRGGLAEAVKKARGGEAPPPAFQGFK